MYRFCEARGGGYFKCMMHVSAEIQVYLKKGGCTICSFLKIINFHNQYFNNIKNT